MDSAPILVTGASGVLGRAVVQALTEAKLPIRQGVRNPAKISVNAVHLDYLIPETFDPALNGARGLFLMAPPLDPRAPEILKPVIDRARKASVSRVVFVSAFGVNLNEQAPLRIVEHEIMNSGIHFSILRPNFFMENFSEGFLSGTIRGQGGIFLAAGEGRTSFISVRDIAAVAATCFTSPPDKQELDLTGREALDHAEVATIISEVSGRPVSYHPLTEDQMVAGARAAGVSESAIGCMTVLYGVVRAGYAAGIAGDVQQVLGRPPISFRQFAQQNVAAWRA